LVDASLETEDVPLDILPGERFPIFSPFRTHSVRLVCHKIRPPLIPLPSRIPAPRQHIPTITVGPWLLGACSPPRHPAWSPSPVAGRAVGGFHRSVYPLCAVLGRCFTPGPVSSAAWFRVANQAEEPFPFWACLCLSDNSQRRQGLPDDACATFGCRIPSLAFTIATCLAGSPRLARAYRLSSDCLQSAPAF
jgi:hypothetical protein